jgi:DNA-binding NarL/FixJ family response regulator
MMDRDVAIDARLRVVVVCAPEILRLGLERVLAQDPAQHLRAASLAAAVGDYHMGPRLLSLLLDWERGERRRPHTADEAERELLRLLAGGHTTAEIAGVLGVAPKTVRNRSSLLYRRLGVRSRSQAVRVAEARGLLDRAPHLG